MPEQIQLDSYSMWIKRKHDSDWYDWGVFVNEPQTVLERLEWGEYTLHPTFPDPIRKTSDRGSRFALINAASNTTDPHLIFVFLGLGPLMSSAQDSR